MQHPWVYVAAEQLESVQSVTVTDIPSLQILDLPIPAYIPSLEIGGSPMSAENFGEGLFRLESVGDLYICDGSHHHMTTMRLKPANGRTGDDQTLHKSRLTLLISLSFLSLVFYNTP
jgi:hypothetical protein